MKFIAQEDGSWCFVCALANCAIHLEYGVPNLSEARLLAGCDGCQQLVEFFGLPLLPTDDATEVLDAGGILSIMHPIYNGHSFFVFPDGVGTISMVNSWLGPLVAKGIGHPEISPLIVSNFGDHWVLDVSLP